MAKFDYMSILYSKEKSPLDFNFDTLIAPSMYNWLQPYQCDQLYNIASSVKYASKVKMKYKAIDEIMTKCNCRKIASGTNRVVYMPYEYKGLVFKIAIDRVGLSDNPAEYKNQFVLKPDITKIFEVHPSGAIGSVERVKPVTSIEEYISIADDVYNLLVKKIIGRYVLEDIGTNFFMNIGVREGYGPVLLDFPYVYELDGSKLYCNDTSLGSPCCGEIDYDDGFNYLVCTKCGKKYNARDLQSTSSNSSIKIIKEGAEVNMKSIIVEDGKVVAQAQGTDSISTKNQFRGIIDTKDPIGRKRRRKDKIFNKVPSGSMIVDDSPQTIGDVIGKKMEDALFAKKLEELRTPTEKYEEKVEEQKIGEEVVSNIYEAMQQPPEEEEPDYSKYGLEKVELESDGEHVEETEHQYEEVETYEKIPKKQLRKDDPSNKY